MANRPQTKKNESSNPAPTKPEGFADELGPYGPVGFADGEPIWWGFEILHQIGEERFVELRKRCHLECLSMGHWAVVTRELSQKEALEKYGPVKEVIRGPRGGYHGVVFEKKTFHGRNTKHLAEGF